MYLAITRLVVTETRCGRTRYLQGPAISRRPADSPRDHDYDRYRRSDCNIRLRIYEPKMEIARRFPGHRPILSATMIWTTHTKRRAPGRDTCGTLRSSRIPDDSPSDTHAVVIQAKEADTLPFADASRGWVEERGVNFDIPRVRDWRLDVGSAGGGPLFLASTAKFRPVSLFAR